jgi:HSP20 family protein
MALTRYEPWGMLNQLHREMDRLFAGQYPSLGEEAATAANWVPAVDIKVEDDRYIIHADLPGVDPKDIDITMEQGVLTIQGTRETVNKEESDKYTRTERVSGSFFRRFTLPDSADIEKISAKSSNGVLELVIPKQEKVQPRKISVEG